MQNFDQKFLKPFRGCYPQTSEAGGSHPFPHLPLSAHAFWPPLQYFRRSAPTASSSSRRGRSNCINPTLHTRSRVRLAGNQPVSQFCRRTDDLLSQVALHAPQAVDTSRSHRNLLACLRIASIIRTCILEMCGRRFFCQYFPVVSKEMFTTVLKSVTLASRRSANAFKSR